MHTELEFYVTCHIDNDREDEMYQQKKETTLLSSINAINFCNEWFQKKNYENFQEPCM